MNFKKLNLRTLYFKKIYIIYDICYKIDYLYHQ